MRVLHVIDRDASPGHIVVATSDGDEQFELSVDRALRSAVSGATAAVRTTPAGTDGEPGITPREIQVRVRSGEEPADIAAEQGAGLDWVRRFAEPVLAERRRVADEARRAKARRSTADGQTVVFGEAVDDRFAKHGIDPQTVTWDAARRADGQWAITARWVGGQREHAAEWSLRLSARTVAPVDDTAADLLSDRPIRPIEPPAEPVRAAAPPLAPGLVAFPVLSEPARQPDADDVGWDDLVTSTFDDHGDGSDHVTDSNTDDNTDVGIGILEPVLPMAIPDDDLGPTGRIPLLRNLGIARPAHGEDERTARATVPSWDDILLGVRRKRD